MGNATVNLSETVNLKSNGIIGASVNKGVYTAVCIASHTASLCKLSALNSDLAYWRSSVRNHTCKALGEAFCRLPSPFEDARSSPLLLSPWPPKRHSPNPNIAYR